VDELVFYYERMIVVGYHAQNNEGPNVY